MTTPLAQEAARYINLVDLTSLNLQDTEDDIRSLCAKACGRDAAAESLRGVSTAAVCVYPKWISLAKNCLKDFPSVTVATVVNFPEGTKTVEESAEDIALAKSDGVDEIDFVIDWRRYKTEQSFLKEYVEGMVKLCKPCLTKVILETSELTPVEIRSAARTSIAAGVDFLKTSTGKVKSGGATVGAVKIFAEEIKESGRSVGIKPSGGIKTIEDCRSLLKIVTEILGSEKYKGKTHFRFGASGVRDHLLNVIINESSKGGHPRGGDSGDLNSAAY